MTVKYRTYIETSCLFGNTFSRFWIFFIRKPNCAGLGLLAKTLTIPAGNDNDMSPDNLT